MIDTVANLKDVHVQIHVAFTIYYVLNVQTNRQFEGGMPY